MSALVCWHLSATARPRPASTASAHLRPRIRRRSVRRMKANRRSPLRALRELALPRDERAAARAERRVEAQMRRERDNRYSTERRAARRDADAWRDRAGWGGGA